MLKLGKLGIKRPDLKQFFVFFEIPLNRRVCFVILHFIFIFIFVNAQRLRKWVCLGSRKRIPTGPVHARHGNWVLSIVDVRARAGHRVMSFQTREEKKKKKIGEKHDVMFSCVLVDGIKDEWMVGPTRTELFSHAGADKLIGSAGGSHRCEGIGFVSVVTRDR